MLTEVGDDWAGRRHEPADAGPIPVGPSRRPHEALEPTGWAVGSGQRDGPSGRWCIKLWDVTSLGSVQIVGFFDVAARLCTDDGPIEELVGTARSFLCWEERIQVTFPYRSILSDYVHMNACCVFIVSVLYVRNCLVQHFCWCLSSFLDRQSCTLHWLHYTLSLTTRVAAVAPPKSHNLIHRRHQRNPTTRYIIVGSASVARPLQTYGMDGETDRTDDASNSAVF